MSRIIHFEIPADNPERAIEFYSKAFQWTFHKWEGGPMAYWLASTGPKEQPGIDGAIMPRQHPGQGISNVIGVTSIQDAIAAVEAAGGKVLMPATEIPGVGVYAACEDTEGNGFGLMQSSV